MAAERYADTHITGVTQATLGSKCTVRTTKIDGHSVISTALSISPIIAINEPIIGSDSQMSVSPNPSSDVVEIWLAGERSEPVSVSLTLSNLLG